MALKKPRIVFWCGSGANQQALDNKIAAEFDIAGIVLDERPGGARKRKLSQIPGIIWDRLQFRKIYGAWKKLMTHYNQHFPAWPDKPLLKVPGINSEATRSFTENLAP